ncbi:MAG: bifunctional 3,4-dihydroxy-2-butanone-4-phosphate synthase/GTP cyclohydrolase II [Bacteroidetes bacterium]|nr:bifunctional 3,4-dihydroxy-2-butanone-4-phosphate synthase/GTP cyclohydrolase II [Bacteroidota bacterium]
MDTPGTDAFDSIESAIKEIRGGRLIIVVDDEDRENEGDFVGAATTITPDLVNFMAREGRGLICTPMTAERAASLELNLMVEENTSLYSTSFTVSVDYSHGTSTGISTADRAATIRALADHTSRANDFARPGHVFPLIAREGGVLRRTGHTEATVDLVQLAGLPPVGVLVEIMNVDGTMARTPELLRIAREHEMKIITISALVAYRMAQISLIKRVASVRLPTQYGTFNLTAYEDASNGDVHLALCMGSWTSDEPILTRVHSQCVTGDLFASLRCDCGDQLHTAMRRVAVEGKGVVLYMKQEGRGIGLLNKLRAYQLQDQEGLDTVEANLALGFDVDHRDYGIGCQILRDLGIRKLRLMTNNPTKRVGLDGYGLEIIESIPIEVPANQENAAYLRTKRDRMGHILPSLDSQSSKLAGRKL